MHSRAAPSSSTGRRITTTASTIPRSTSTSTACCSSAAPGRSVIRRRRGREHAAAGGADQEGHHSLPCIGDGRQSGTSGSPSILNASPEAAAGGGLAILQTGDRVRIDLNKRTANILISDAELAQRRADRSSRRLSLPEEPDAVAGNPAHHGGAIRRGMVLKPAVQYQRVAETKGVPRIITRTGTARTTFPGGPQGHPGPRAMRICPCDRHRIPLRSMRPGDGVSLEGRETAMSSQIYSPPRRLPQTG